MADWRNVMFRDESTSRLAQGGYKLVRRPSRVSRYDSRYNNKTVKQPKSVIVRVLSVGIRVEGVYIFSLRTLQ